jgi:hypothetical protein
MVEIGGPKQPKCPTNQSIVKDKEKLPFIYIRFIFTSILYIMYKSRVKDQK